MADEPLLDAVALRAMGIDHELMSDEELESSVAMLRSLGIELDAMANTNITLLAGPAMVRPDATIIPRDIFGPDDDLGFVREMVLALGFDFDNDDMRLTQGEVDAMRFFIAQRELFGDEDTLALIRVAGSAMARIARSVLSTLRMRVELPILHAEGELAEVNQAYRVVTEEQLPLFLDALGALLRRHFALMSGTVSPWLAEDSEAAAIEDVLVGFVDMVGFTSFTEQAGQAALLETVRTFEGKVNAIVVANRGTLVKLIGDEAMFVAPDVEAGLQIAAELCCLPLNERGPTSVRVGLASGQVMAIDGDYYGTVVNVAARVVQAADPNTIMVSDAVRDGAASTWTFRERGNHELRGISTPVALWELDGTQAVAAAGGARAD